MSIDTSRDNEDTVNPQVTDAVEKADVDVPANAVGHVYQTIAQSTGIAFQNATHAQQNLNEAIQAATIQGVGLLYSIDTATTGEATGKILSAVHPVVDEPAKDCADKEP
ncbi:MAG TPA: RebB family R body protein [Polyangium sp.]|nr:RebB family R body protein [Polyangium sp.]